MKLCGTARAFFDIEGGREQVGQKKHGSRRIEEQPGGAGGGKDQIGHGDHRRLAGGVGQAQDAGVALVGELDEPTL